MKGTVKERFSSALRWAIENHEIVQNDFAKKCGTSSATVTDYKYGRRAGDEDTREKMARNLGYDYRDFLDLGQWILDGNDGKNWKAVRTSLEPGQHPGDPEPVSEKQSNDQHQFDLDDILIKAKRVLTSKTIHRSALLSNIRAFNEAVEQSEENETMKNELREVNERLERIEQLLTIEMSEKKQAGNNC